MKQEYAQYLSDVHSKLKTPEHIVLNAVAEVTKSKVVSRQRIIAGEANEVYDVRVAAGHALIVRISRDAEKDFEQERWAIDQCAKLDVPVPKILLIKHLSAEDAPLDICIQEKLHGEVLTATAELDRIPRNALKAIAIRVGELLSRVHSIATKGHGYLNGDGVGEFQMTVDTLGKQEERYLALARRVGFPEEAMAAVLAILVRLWASMPGDPRLVHNDFRAKHVMVKDGRVTGIIDWGEVASSAPMTDFAEWDYWDGTLLPLEWLAQGYGDRQLFGTGFEEGLRLRRIEYGLCVLWWYDYRGFAYGVEDAKAKLQRDLAFFTR